MPTIPVGPIQGNGQNGPNKSPSQLQQRKVTQNAAFNPTNFSPFFLMAKCLSSMAPFAFPFDSSNSFGSMKCAK
jgi:hypothetical protein